MAPPPKTYSALYRPIEEVGSRRGLSELVIERLKQSVRHHWLKAELRVDVPTETVSCGTGDHSKEDKIGYSVHKVTFLVTLADTISTPSRRAEISLTTTEWPVAEDATATRLPTQPAQTVRSSRRLSFMKAMSTAYDTASDIIKSQLGLADNQIEWAKWESLHGAQAQMELIFERDNLPDDTVVSINPTYHSWERDSDGMLDICFKGSIEVGGVTRDWLNFQWLLNAKYEEDVERSRDVPGV